MYTAAYTVDKIHHGHSLLSMAQELTNFIRPTTVEQLRKDRRIECDCSIKSCRTTKVYVLSVQ